VDTVIGGVAEFDAAEISPQDAAASGIHRVFLKRGPAGAALLMDGSRLEVEPMPVEVVNGLGAGDAFAAAAGSGILSGMAPAALLRWANAAGAMVTMQLACAAAMPSHDELRTFLDERA
jgi:5-dehydro-2-deoxygluconokinase